MSAKFSIGLEATSHSTARRSSSSTSTSSHSSSEDDECTLPFPTPLPRSAFVAPDFSPSIYLSSLRNRHQTLEDLRAELRSRTQLLNRELLDLVNSNYQDFLGLGGSLKGGEEKVEGVRVGLMGFGKSVEDVRRVVVQRKVEADELFRRREEIRKRRIMAWELLKTEARIGELEGRLMLESVGNKHVEPSDSDANVIPESTEDEDEDEDDEDDEYENEDELESTYVPTHKLRKHVQDYTYILHQILQTGQEHPFIVAQQHRVTRIRNTILLDLATALKQAKQQGEKGKGRCITILGLYGDMGEEREALKVIQDSRGD
ncbi:hypothetical protein M501DRAFT_1000298 [Patellaria atrata CBS 101060]|uniref:Conserved oligomeric Golgi complex subunit 2 n=1 Tax=Patellaria atrata CBS 101060 TaxID=1346257 RepID=A0A9P4VRN8_9PEZI|nr:hypothetical protein M501DRAFT_1000298 [Patellaria atrata CBS 101060]